MFALTVIGVFVLIVAIIIYVEYKNEKDYQQERKKRQSERQKTRPPYNPKERIQKPHIKKQEKSAKLKEKTPGAKTKVKPRKKETVPKEEKSYIDLDLKKDVPTEEVIQEKPKSVELPKANYPRFNYERLVKMGLSLEEADGFVQELIPQIETQIPLIQEALDKKDFHSMERLTHSIKGSSTTIGTGGISDLLVDFNTYLKNGDNEEIAQEYLKHLQYYYEILKKQYAR